MKRSLKPVTCALVAALSLSVVPGVKLGPLGVDVVSAATGAATPAAPAPKAPAAPKATTPKVTAAPKVTTVATEVARLLAVGSNGSDVALLQTKLNENGFKLTVDGIFGERTSAAVKEYQGKNGLKVDGIVGPKTLAKLTPVTPAQVVTPEPAPVATPEPTPAPEPVVKPEPTPAPVDVVTSASMVTDEASLLNAMSANGSWIVLLDKDFTTDKELVLDGEFTNKEKLDRKLALYTQDADKNVTGSFTLTAPKLRVNSPATRIQNGTFKGDLYVSAPNLQLRGATIDGDVYFTTQEAKDTFVADEKSKITGKQILADVDVVATASLVHDADAFEKAISKDGTWIIALLRDLTTDKDLVVEGEFRDKNLPEKDFKRKVGLYTHNDPADKKKATHSFTLTAPSITFKSPNSTLQYGYFVGDIYVESNNFSLVNCEVKGNVYFATQEAMDTFTMEGSTVSGVQEVKQK